MAGALYGLSKFSLVRRTNPGVLRIDYLGLAGNEALQKHHLLVINILQVLGTKKALNHEFLYELRKFTNIRKYMLTQKPI